MPTPAWQGGAGCPYQTHLKATGTMRLKLKHDEPPSKFAFNLNLRRYSVAAALDLATDSEERERRRRQITLELFHQKGEMSRAAAAVVGQCRLN